MRARPLGPSRSDGRTHRALPMGEWSQARGAVVNQGWTTHVQSQTAPEPQVPLVERQCVPLDELTQLVCGALALGTQEQVVLRTLLSAVVTDLIWAQVVVDPELPQFELLPEPPFPGWAHG